MIKRISINTAVTCVLLALIAAVWTREVRVVGGVLAGGALIGLAFRALSGLVDSLVAGASAGSAEGSQTRDFRPVSRGFPLVKVFTRHVILAVAAYVMMVRLHLDPVGMVVGVTSVVVAAIIEAARPR